MHCCGSGLPVVSFVSVFEFGFESGFVSWIRDSDPYQKVKLPKPFEPLAALSTRSCRYMYFCDKIAVYPVPSQTEW
jgi:hypothetical protein